MLLVGPIARPEQINSVRALNVTNFPLITYENTVIIVTNNAFHKTKSKISEKINAFIYEYKFKPVEYSQLLFSLYLLIPELQFNEPNVKLLDNIEQILNKKVIKKGTQSGDEKIEIQPYPRSMPYYKISPEIALTHYNAGVYNLMRMLTGYQYTFISNKDTLMSSRVTVNKYKSKSQLQERFLLKAHHNKSLYFINSIASRIATLYVQGITQISFLFKIERYLYSDDKGNWMYNLNVDLTSFIELYKKETVYKYAVLNIESSEYITWGELDTDSSVVISVIYKMIFDLTDKYNKLSDINRQIIFQGFSTDKNELYNNIDNSWAMVYVKHVEVFYTYNTIAQILKTDQCLVVKVKLQVEFYEVYYYIVIGLPKYQKTFYEIRGYSKPLKDLLLSMINDPNTTVMHQVGDKNNIGYLIIM